MPCLSHAPRIVTTCVIGCGNVTRGDDGVGPYVIAALAPRVPPAVTLCDAGSNGMEVIYRARGAERLILIDALASDETPGALYELPGTECAQAAPRLYSLHAFRWEHALAAARQLYGEDFLARTTVYLVGAESLDYRTQLSAPVRAAADRLVERLIIALQ